MRELDCNYRSRYGSSFYTIHIQQYFGMGMGSYACETCGEGDMTGNV